MTFGRKATPVATISHDILTDKQNEMARLGRQADEAVDLVTLTISNLEDINQQIGIALSEVDAYIQDLADIRAAMSKQRSNNTAIISNFEKLLDTNGTEQ